jgi:hypothetical protein
VAVAIGFSLLMFNVEGIAGLVQRGMFLVGVLWYSAEAVRAGRLVATHANAGGSM